jgi:hypothetical protein
MSGDVSSTTDTEDHLVGDCGSVNDSLMFHRWLSEPHNVGPYVVCGGKQYLESERLVEDEVANDQSKKK